MGGHRRGVGKRTADRPIGLCKTDGHELPLTAPVKTQTRTRRDRWRSSCIAGPTYRFAADWNRSRPEPFPESSLFGTRHMCDFSRPALGRLAALAAGLTCAAPAMGQPVANGATRSSGDHHPWIRLSAISSRRPRTIPRRRWTSQPGPSSSKNPAVSGRVLTRGPTFARSRGRLIRGGIMRPTRRHSALQCLSHPPTTYWRWFFRSARPN